jgi:hypothetical protein
MNRVHQNHTRTAISGVHQFHTNTTPPTQKSGFYWAFSCVSDRTWREQSLSFQSVVSFVNWMSLVQSRHRAPNFPHKNPNKTAKRGHLEGVHNRTLKSPVHHFHTNTAPGGAL